jgi:hypothetical protein
MILLLSKADEINKGTEAFVKEERLEKENELRQSFSNANLHCEPLVQSELRKTSSSRLSKVTLALTCLAMTERKRVVASLGAWTGGNPLASPRNCFVASPLAVTDGNGVEIHAVCPYSSVVALVPDSRPEVPI